MKILTIFISQSILIGLAFFMCSCQKKEDNSQLTMVKEQIEEPPPPPSSDLLHSLKEKELLDYIQTAKTVKPNPNNGAPFNQLDYDKIIAYDFQGEEEMYEDAIDRKGKFIPVILKQQFLTQQQADHILSALAKNSSYGGGSAACFRPHLGLVFFKGNKKVNQISICLSCNASHSEIEIPAKKHKLVNKGTKDEYSLEGFTSSGKKAIAQLCKKINFQYGR
ncbi:hypothetical protein [Chryseobacterium sp. Mn2064]|uniref:hypothetical protein n=1 Tax=Chryseobacterium sp. Mn2064 TaxID=3395263 RepID=UPI003BC29EFD